MEQFSADWLTLREPADHVARAAALPRALAEQWGDDRGLRAVDLGAGAGSNVRYLMPRLPQVTHWTLVDHDAGLLAHAVARLEPGARAQGVTLETRTQDLSDLEALPLEGCRLVTASALLDLAGPAWVAGCAARCRSVGADALFAITYDGRITCDPVDPDDARVRDLVNAHQRRPKDLVGAACGPDGTRRALAAFVAQGYGVHTVQSDWVLGPETSALQRPLVDGWAAAAIEQSPDDRALVEAWRARRMAQLTHGELRVRVGHHDLLAWGAGPVR